MEPEQGEPQPEPASAGSIGAGAETATAEASGVRLRPPRNRVDPRAVRWWTAQALAHVVPLLGAIVAGYVLLDDSRDWLRVVFAVVAVGGVAYVIVMPRWRFHVHRWETTPDAVYAASGWVLQEWRVAPLSRVQTIDTQRGPLQQLFGLASVTVTTASAKGEIKIDGLDRTLAVDLVHRLTETTQAIPGDAT